MVNCWADKLGDCSEKQSKEHLVSKGLFEEDEFYEPSIVIPWGFNWCRDEPKRISVSSFSSKILCEHHNNLLSSVDAEAIHAYNVFRKLWLAIQNPKSILTNEVIYYEIDGYLLERWFLKTAINILYSDCGLDKPPIEFIELAFGLKRFPENIGLYMADSLRQPIYEFDDGIKFTPIMRNYDTFTTVLFEFRGWKFALPLINEPLPTSLNNIEYTPFSHPPIDRFIQEFLKSRLIYHLKQFDLDIGGNVKFRIKFNWDPSPLIKELTYANLRGWLSNKKIMFYTSPVATDANGEQVLCNIQFNKQKGKFEIVIPQDFLNRAKYPVRIKGGFYPKRDDAIKFYKKELR